ncbi:MAG: efflux RND transporter periplasmic adaptor subunit [Proteobacteria bacterium]|nr:efflux RND transporter periplasmic adaptor subunit [Pseudomonadota bacterium]
MQHRLLIGLIGLATALRAFTAPLETYSIGATGQEGSYTATGTVEAVRQGTLGAQVSGRVLEVLVRSGESVKAGQALIRIDADDAAQAAAAGAATASGAAARLAAAKADYERALRLRAQDYISVAAMQRSEAALHSAEADAQATGAAASAARTRAGWRTVTAPYDGNVTDVMVAVGDLATPGRPLIAIYAPGAVRVIAQIPESIAGRLQASKPAFLLNGEPGASLQHVTSWSAVNAVDPATHSVEVRAELPAGTHVQPGQFARVRLPLKGSAAELRVPTRAIVTRSEVTAVYVVDGNGSAHLRQVRLGPVVGDEVTVLSGLQGGEKIALDPVTAGRN